MKINRIAKNAKVNANANKSVQFQSEKESHLVLSFSDSPDRAWMLLPRLYYTYRNTEHIIDWITKYSVGLKCFAQHFESDPFRKPCFIYHQQLYYYGAKEEKDEVYLGKNSAKKRIFIILQTNRDGTHIQFDSI